MTDYNYWQNALDGNFGPVHGGEPQCGFYKRKASKSGGFNAVAIWRSESSGQIMACEIKPDKSNLTVILMSLVEANDSVYVLLER